MTSPIVVRRRASYDLAAAFEWYEEQRSGLGQDFLSAIQSTFESIEIHPEMFALAHGDVRRAILSRFPSPCSM